VDLRGATSKGRGRDAGREGRAREGKEGRGPTSKARGGNGGIGLSPKPKNQTMAVATTETIAELIDSRYNCSIGDGI